MTVISPKLQVYGILGENYTAGIEMRKYHGIVLTRIRVKLFVFSVNSSIILPEYFGFLCLRRKEPN